MLYAPLDVLCDGRHMVVIAPNCEILDLGNCIDLRGCVSCEINETFPYSMLRYPSPNIVEAGDNFCRCCKNIDNLMYMTTLKKVGNGCFENSSLTHPPPNIVEAGDDFCYNCKNIGDLQYMIALKKVGDDCFAYSSITHSPPNIIESGDYFRFSAR